MIRISLLIISLVLIVSIFLTGGSSEPVTEYLSTSTTTLVGAASETQTTTISITPPLPPVNVEEISLSPPRHLLQDGPFNVEVLVLGEFLAIEG
jgi:hypothetical protein